MIEIEDTTFIVYTVDSPTYTSAMFGGTFESPFPISNACHINGSVVIISGGLYRSNDEDDAQAEYLAAGLVQVALKSAGMRFGERAVLSMISPQDPVVVVIEIHSRCMCDHWMSVAQKAGFQAFQAGWAVVCVGKGSELPGLQWLENSVAWADTSIFVGNGTLCPLQQSIIERARSGEDGIELIRGLLSSSTPIEDQALIEERMLDCRVIASLGGLEEQDLVINRNETDFAGLDAEMMRVAQEIGIPLYYAGTHADLESIGWFRGSELWKPFHQGWIRKV